MEQGSFFFIADDYFTAHDPEGRLMQNKEGIHNRPCFYAFPDNKVSDIFWCVPISSQVAKFEKIAQKKVERQLAKGYKDPKCNTIRFGEVLGQKRAFLIQNMFPITASYVAAIYIDKHSHNPVTIAPATEKDIVTNAKDILKLVFRGYNYLVFSDIQKTYIDLIAELNLEKQRNEIAKPAASTQRAEMALTEEQSHQHEEDLDAVQPAPMPSRQSFQELAAAAKAEAAKRNDARASGTQQHKLPEKQER